MKAKKLYVAICDMELSDEELKDNVKHDGSELLHHIPLEEFEWEVNSNSEFFDPKEEFIYFCDKEGNKLF